MAKGIQLDLDDRKTLKSLLKQLRTAAGRTDDEALIPFQDDEDAVLLEKLRDGIEAAIEADSNGEFVATAPQELLACAVELGIIKDPAAKATAKQREPEEGDDGDEEPPRKAKTKRAVEEDDEDDDNEPPKRKKQKVAPEPEEEDVPPDGAPEDTDSVNVAIIDLDPADVDTNALAALAHALLSADVEEIHIVKQCKKAATAPKKSKRAAEDDDDDGSTEEVATPEAKFAKRLRAGGDLETNKSRIAFINRNEIKTKGDMAEMSKRELANAIMKWARKEYGWE